MFNQANIPIFSILIQESMDQTHIYFKHWYNLPQLSKNLPNENKLSTHSNSATATVSSAPETINMHIKQSTTVSKEVQTALNTI